jgi:hypothetical protein
MIYVISFDTPEEAISQKIVDWIRRHYTSYANPVPGTWIVDGALVADQIHTDLTPLVGAATRMVIVKAGLEAMWYGIAPDDAEWIAATFPGSLSERIPGKTEEVP